MQENKWKVKDFITIGIYNVIFVVLMLLAGITNLTPYTYLFYPFTGMLFGAILFLLAAVKVPKRGSILLMSMLMIIYLFATGVQGMISAVSILIFAIIADLILSRNRKSSKCIMAAYLVFSGWMTIGGEFRIFVFPEAYFKEALESGLNESYVEILRGMTSWGWWAVSILAGLLGAFLGMLFARAMMKKHLQRAGIV